ncbi:MAG: dihydroorotate dehydrogenase electron transfer subunit [Bacteroidetes bacterium]|nr:MAG: dihydroorotate dehydrogenase electron transfer subunit [Bacteroidota bacterium]
MAKILADHEIVDISFPAKGHLFITLKSPVEIPPVFPGNFAELHIAKSPEVFLRRPFGILDVDYEKKLISFYIKMIGKGTRELGKYKIGEMLNAIYPLGNSFTIPKNGNKVLIVGGGSGIATFILLGKLLKNNNIETTFLIGGRAKVDILLTNELRKYGDVLATTEDGSFGEKGFVTDHSIFKSDNFGFDKIYTCGPEPMMKAVGGIAQKHKIDCEVSLENMMACGFGVCLCCVTATKKGNQRVCMEGPVFKTEVLKWF